METYLFIYLDAPFFLRLFRKNLTCHFDNINKKELQAFLTVNVCIVEEGELILKNSYLLLLQITLVKI